MADADSGHRVGDGGVCVRRTGQYGEAEQSHVSEITDFSCLGWSWSRFSILGREEV